MSGFHSSFPVFLFAIVCSIYAFELLGGLPWGTNVFELNISIAGGDCVWCMAKLLEIRQCNLTGNELAQCQSRIAIMYRLQ